MPTLSGSASFFLFHHVFLTVLNVDTLLRCLYASSLQVIDDAVGFHRFNRANA